MILLPLKDALELYTVLDALNVWASAAEETGDENEAQRADAINRRVRELQELVVLDAQEWLRHAGIGRGRGRPQG